MRQTPGLFRKRKVYCLVPPSPSPLGSWNHRVGGRFLLWSLILRGLYQSIPEQGLRLSKSAQNGFGAPSRCVLVGGRISKLPQSDSYCRARRVVSQPISVATDCKQMGVVVEKGRSKSPPCRERRDKDGAPSGVEMSERVGQPPADPICQPCVCSDGYTGPPPKVTGKFGVNRR